MRPRPGRSRAVSAAVTALVVCLWVALAGPVGVAAAAGVSGPATEMVREFPRADPPRGSASAPAREESAAVLAVHVSRLDPIIAVPGRDVVAQVTVRNSGTGPTLGPVRVAVRLGSATSLLTRHQVRSFATQGLTGGRVVAHTTTSAPLAARASTQVTVTIPAAALTLNRAYGVLPLQVDAQVEVPPGSAARGASASRATYLPFQTRKEYQPLQLSVVVPLTPDPDPALLTATGQERADAWADAVGPGSRIDRILAATTPFPVTWAVDPALLDTPGHVDVSTTGPPTPSAPPTSAAPTTGAPPTAAPTATPSPTDPADPAQAELAQRLSELTPQHPVWALPRNDPDLSALVASSPSTSSLRSLLADPDGVGDQLGLPGVARVAWPVGTPLSGESVRRLSEGFGATGPAAVVAPASAYDADPDITGPAARRTAGGTPIITFDDELSRLLENAQDGQLTTELTLQMLAESVTLLAESPGRTRQVVIAAGRDFDPDPAAVQGVLGALAGTPWIQLGSSQALVDPAGTRVSVDLPRAGAADPLSPGPSPVTTSVVARLERQQDEVAGLASVLSATPDSGVVPDADTVDALASSRWRFAPGVWTHLDTIVTDRIHTLTTGVSVVPSTINFFADHGVLQVTVVNRLDVEVHDVHVVFAPQGRPPRLRVTSEPAPLTIRPGSRTTVRVQVEAVAAGVVPVSTHLATPQNTRLGTDATVRVRVQPTNGWLMLALGGLAGVVFLAGLYRALRAGRPRVSTENLKELDR